MHTAPLRSPSLASYSCTRRAVRVRADIIRRQLRLLSMLGAHPRGLSSERLAALLRASRATVDRDLASLRASAIASIQRKRVAGEVWHALDGVPLAVLVTPGQLAALRLARASLGPLERSGIVRELDALLGETPAPSGRIAIVSKQRRSAAPLGVIEAALDHGRRLTIEARVASRGGRAQRYTVDPLALRVVGGDAYLHAWALERDGVRTFKLDRIQSAVPTGERAEDHPEVDLDALFATAVKTWSSEPVLVRVRIAPSAAWALSEYPLVLGQRLIHEPDGSAIVEAEVSGLVEVSRWVLAWGRQAEALSPPALRAAVREELEGALDCYQGKESVQLRSPIVSGPEPVPPARQTSKRPRSTARTTQVRGRR